MSKHTLSGYRALLQMRSRPTLLVEGDSDRQVIARALNGLRTDAKISEHVLIDHAGMLESVADCCGNREVVEKVATVLAAVDNLVVFCDREFREFCLDSKPKDLLACHRVSPESRLYWTRGHSIENYLLADDFVLAYVEHLLTVEVSTNQLEVLSTLLPQVRRWLCAFSVAAYKHQILRRAGALPQMPHWIYSQTSGCIELNLKAIGRSLEEREVALESVEEVLACAERVYHEIDPQDCLVLWLPHGHILMTGLWSAVAAFLENSGVSQGVARSFERNGEERLRFLAARWGEALRQSLQNGSSSSDGDAPIDFLRTLLRLAGFLGKSTAGQPATRPDRV